MAAPKKLSIAECDKLLLRPGSILEMDTEAVDGCEYRVWKNGSKIIRSYLLDQFERWANRVFINTILPEPAPKEQRRTYTYRDVHRLALQLAAWLRGRDVKQGSRVGLVGFNQAEWVITFVAIHLLGAVPVIVNAWIQPDALVHCLKLAKPMITLADPPSAAAYHPHRADLTASGVGEVRRFRSRLTCLIYSWSSVSHLGKDAPHLDYDKLTVDPTHVVDAAAGRGLEDLHRNSDGAIFFTSGTTGMPKGVLLRQQALLHNLNSGRAALARAALRAGAPIDATMKLLTTENTEQAVVLGAVPLFHITGCGQLLMWLNDGRQMVFMRRWSVKDAIDLLVKYKITALGGVPSISSSILQSPLLPQDHELTSVSYGGAAPPARLGNDMKQRWPNIIVSHAWGMTEAAGLITAAFGSDYLEKPKSAGPPVPINDVRVVDIETKKALGPNQVGALQIRGVNVMVCYLNDEAATKKAKDAQGWFDTGDAGYIDDEGFIFISDRIKDIIIRGGENISSEEVENALYMDDRIAEAASVPVPDDILGELVAVGVSLKPGASATPEDIISAVTQRLRREARPVFVWISDTKLPTNANGKFMKNEIKKIVQSLYTKRNAREAKL